jgi:lipopolysaccharide transport system permease protein
MAETSTQIPNIIITAERGSFYNFLCKIIEHKSLFYVLTFRDFKLRFQETKAGNFWFILQPLINLLMFTIFLGYVARVDTRNIPYAAFFLSGLVPVTFFNSVLTRMGGSILENAHMIKKIYFPRVIIPLSTVGAIFSDYLIMIILLCILSLWYGYIPSFSSLWVVPFTSLLLVMFAIGLGLSASVVTIYYKDFRIILPFIAQMLVYICPIIYPITLVPEKYRFLYSLNPLSVIIDKWRSCFFDLSEVPNIFLLSPIIAALLSITLGLHYFYRHEQKLANYL